MEMTQAEEQAKNRLEDTLDVITKWRDKLKNLTLEINLPEHVWRDLCYLHEQMGAALKLNGR